MNKQVINEQQSSILLIINKEEKKVYGMKGVGKYDEFETAEVNKENQDQFKLFDKNSDFLRDFLINFFTEMQNPILFKFFIVPKSESVNLAKEIQISITHPSKEGGLLLKKYELLTEHLQESLKSEQKNSNSKKQQEMSKVLAKSKGRKM